MEIMDNPLIEPEIINSIKDLLIQRQETIAVAESVTSGLIQAALSQAIDASKFYQGGITAYNIGQKYKHLNVEPIHALNCDCISEKVAQDMAINCCMLFTSDWGIGITGYASIIPEQKNELIAYYAISYKQQILVIDKVKAPEAKPYNVQLFFMRNLIKAVEECIRTEKAEK